MKISVEVNPGLKSKDPLELVHVKAIGWNDTLHYLFGTIGAPSLVVALTMLPANLTVSAARRLSRGPSGTVVILVLPPLQLVEFDDVHDTGILPEVWSHPAAVSDYSMGDQFLWSLTVQNSSSDSVLVSWNATDYNGTAFPSGMEFIIQASVFGDIGRADTLPRLAHSMNSTQFDLHMKNLNLGSGYNQTRFALSSVFASWDPAVENPAENVTIEEHFSLDDEFTPGVFRMLSLETTSFQKEGEDGGFIQWRPVAYTKSERDINDATLVSHYPLQEVDGAATMQHSLVRAALGNITRLPLHRMNVSFGRQEDGFYQATNFISWTFLVGYGSPPSDKFSLLVILSIAGAFGLPVLAAIIGGVWALLKLSPQDPGSGKKKGKFVPLFSPDGPMHNVMQLPGRHVCNCQASRHALVGNCLKCGRIVCNQEGSGPCTFCGTLVCTKEEREVLARGSKKSKELERKLIGGDGGRGDYASIKEVALGLSADENLKKALEQKDRLLEYDRNCKIITPPVCIRSSSERRTRVIDDESDYFALDTYKWLSPAQKAILKAREATITDLKERARRSKKFTLDFAGRRVVEEEVEPWSYEVDESVLDDVLKIRDDYELHPSGLEFAPRYMDLGNQTRDPRGKGRTRKEMLGNDDLVLRIQDKELQEMSDGGFCLSMHQPWASLLVAGIKKHEGRSWYTPHRGRLWIAAAAKVPLRQEIDELEHFYRVYYEDEKLKFPSQYPVGCLLGCVDVTEVLSQEDYRERYPEGESSSPYVFICDNPHELLVKFPVKGRHKIYKLDPRIHEAARKTLMKTFD
ncbi:unnamed protein product [Darwinula stevensoni]|uniref:Activating signal cointegrator 1 n=1 Tax=Darwinula stevensoni TaxID=69355 RepID=A0A7R9AA93_9CRUS|nr:unnamed protein product [Darwinula stevensoni]CAG0898176.1 unnamed protein product [Darwinula stevensoni]